MKKGVRVFIVDDSAVVRQLLSKMISESVYHMHVIGTAPNGAVALEKMALPKFKPDVVLMDIMMPEMDGFETINHIMDRFPTPVIIVSSLTQKEVNMALSNLGMSAFESGTIEFVKKPDSNVPTNMKRFERELIKKIAGLAQADLKRALSAFDFNSFLKDEAEEISEIIAPEIAPVSFHDKIIVIGASTGGPRAISLILSKIPSVSPPIVIVQHMPTEMVQSWAQRLQTLYPHLKIKIPKNGEKIRPNRVYIAPGGVHCGLESGKVFRLTPGERVNFVIPAIDVTLITGARVYGRNILGIILTGMGQDGCDGAKEIKTMGGQILAEHESTSVIYSMPRCVVESNLADEVVALHNIPSVIRRRGWV
ncbi:MAG: chemotaxis-specific protein-glutamate methyltransferase CheB [Candidatus Hermodarchaeota archaeon]